MVCITITTKVFKITKSLFFLLFFGWGRVCEKTGTEIENCNWL